MSEQAKAKGLLAHKFHGTYWAVIGLEFASEDMAKAALPKLGEGWKHGEKHPCVLIWQGESEALAKCKKVLGSFGADEDKIDSLRKSIDHGEPFEVTIPMPDPNQLTLPIG